MATEAERLKAHRTRLLVRCQSAREQRARRELLEAQDAVAAAEQRRDEADQALVQGAQDRINELRAYYDQMAQQKNTTGRGIEALRDKEQDLTKQQQKREQDLKTAQSAISSAKVLAAQTAKALAAEALKTRKRESLADRSFREYREAQSTAEENAVEEEMQDRLSLKPGQAA